MNIFISAYIYIYIYTHESTTVAHSAGAVEYTKCIIAEGVKPTPTSVLNMTLNGEVLVMLDFLGMQSTCSLPSLPSPL